MTDTAQEALLLGMLGGGLGSEYYALMKANAISLFIPSSSDWGDNLVLTDVRNTYNATPSNVGINGTGWLNARQAIRFVGNESITYPASLRSAFNPNTFSILYWLRLPTYSAASTLFYLTDGTNVLSIKHTAANAITIARTGGTNVVLSSVPEHVDLLFGLTKSGNTLTAYAIHSATITSNQVDHSTSFGATTVMLCGFDNASAYSTIEIGEHGFYNTVKSQASIENIYDQMYVAPSVLPILNELGEDSGSDASGTITTAGGSSLIFGVGVSDLDVTIPITTKASSGSFVLALRYQDASNYVKLDLGAANAVVYSRIGGSDSSLITTTVADGDTIRLTLRGSRITMWKNGTPIGSTALTTFQYNTRYQWINNSSASFNATYQIADIYGRAFALDDTNISMPNTRNRDFQRLRATVFDGTLNPSAPFIKNVAGNTALDATREATLREKDGGLFLNGLTAAFSIPYAANQKTKPVTWMVLGTAYSFGGGGFGRYFDDVSDEYLLINQAASNSLNANADYVTTDAFAQKTNQIAVGLKHLAARVLASDDTLDIFWNGLLTITVDTAGVGGQNIATGAIIVGNNAISSGVRGWYGDFFLILIIPAIQMQADLYNRLLRQLLTISYRQALVALHNTATDLLYFATANGNFENHGVGGQPTNTVTTQGDVVSRTGDRGVNFGTGGNINLYSALNGRLTGVFTIQIRFILNTNTSAVLLHIKQDANNYIKIEKTAATTIRARLAIGGVTYDSTFSSLTNATEYQISITNDGSTFKGCLEGALNSSVASNTWSVGALSSTEVVLGAADTSGTNKYDDAIIQLVINPDEALTAIEIMQSYNLHTANGAEWLNYLLTNRNPIKLNNSSGKNLLVSGGAADTLSGAAVGTERAPNGECYLTITSAGHVNIGLTSLAINEKSYDIAIRTTSNMVSTTLCVAYRLYIDSNNYLYVYFGTTANQLIVDYHANSVTDQMTYDTVVADRNIHVRVNIPSAGEVASLEIDGVQVDTVTLTNDIVGASLSDAETVVGALNTSNTSHLQGYCTDLAILELASGTNDYEEFAGALIT